MEIHESIRKIMFELGEHKGYVVNPICLQEYIFKFLQQTYPKNKMNSVMARNVSYVFAVLCNEFYLINLNRVAVKTFYIKHERLIEMNIKQKMLESSLKILKKMLLVEYKNMPHPNLPYSYIRVYKINILRLAEIKGEILNKDDAYSLLLDTTSKDS